MKQPPPIRSANIVTVVFVGLSTASIPEKLWHLSYAEASDSGRVYGASIVWKNLGISAERPVRVAPSHSGSSAGDVERVF